MPALKNQKLELYCQERAKVGATDISAYLAAGYIVKDPTRAYESIKRILKDHNVSARVAEIHVEAALLNEVTLQRVIQQLAGIAFTDIGTVVEWGSTVVRSHVDKVSGERRVVIVNKDWIRFVDSSKIGAGARAAVDKVSLNADGSVSCVKLRSPMPALVALGKHLGMFPADSRKGHTNNGYQNKPLVYVDAPPPETAEQWEARQKRRFADIAAAEEQSAKAPPDQSSH